MHWDTLRLVLAIHRHHTLTAAAVALGVTRTTVGRQLRDAEARLGVRLFDRTPDGLVATAAGDELAQAATEVEARVQVAEGRVLGQDAILRGELRVTTVDFVFDGFPALFASFMERHPGIGLTVRTTDDNLSLRRREADVALRISNAPAGHLVGRRVGRLQFELYATRALVEQVGPDAPLAAYPWIHWADRAAGAWLDRWLETHAPGARVKLRVEGYFAMQRAVQSGIGVHFLGCHVGDADPNLVRLGHRISEHARGLWALTLDELRQTRRIRAFLDHAVAFFGQHQSALDGSWDRGRCLHDGEIVLRRDVPA